MEKNRLYGPKKLVSDLTKCPFATELEEKLRVLQNDEAFLNANSFRDQCMRLNELFRSNSNEKHNTSYEKLRYLFDPPPNKSSLQQQIQKSLSPPGKNGRPASLNDDEILILNEWIMKRFEKKKWPTYEDLESKILKKFNKIATTSMMYGYVHNANNFSVEIVHPMEDERVNFSEADVIRYTKELMEKMIGVRRGFLFNVDEAGQNDYVDARAQYVILPNETTKCAGIPAKRCGRKLTVIHTIASDGQWIKPMFIVPRKCIDSELYQAIPRDNIEVRYQHKGFLNTQIFADWMATVFIPHLKAKRLEKNYDGPALLILDGFSAHSKVTECFSQELLSALNLKICYLAIRRLTHQINFNP